MLATLGKRAYARLTYGYGLTDLPMQARNHEISLQLVAIVY